MLAFYCATVTSCGCKGNNRLAPIRNIVPDCLWIYFRHCKWNELFSPTCVSTIVSTGYVFSPYSTSVTAGIRLRSVMEIWGNSSSWWLTDRQLQSGNEIESVCLIKRVSELTAKLKLIADFTFISTIKQKTLAIVKENKLSIHAYSL